MALVVPEPEEARYTTEFRTYKEDAWYTVWVTLEGNQTLRVRYRDFSENEDILFTPTHFETLEQLHDFNKRFRPLSRQIQDYECRQLLQGVKVCASHHFPPDDVRFYDALVEVVQEREHSFKNTEKESCHCTFILHWLHGPNKGNLTAKDVGDICIVQPALEFHPTVASYLEMARERIESISGQELFADWHNGSETQTTYRLGFSEGVKKGKRRAKKSVFGARSPEGLFPCNSKVLVSRLDGRMEDREFEGKRNVCMILMGNLDRELCPSTVEKFLRRHTLVSAIVFIFPSLSPEIYTRGAIMLDSEKDFQKLCDFLTNPNHIITSSTGRPWVVSEKLVGLKKIKASIGALVAVSKNVSQNGKNGTGNKLKVVYSGSQEFKIASNLRDLFLEFSNHQERLHKKLALLETSIFATGSFNELA